MLRLPNIVQAICAAGRRNLVYDAKLTAKKQESHYDVLNVRADSSAQEIRDAFLKLSKKYHPDVMNNVNSADRTARFVKITEAYQTLVKESTRKDYDENLSFTSGGTREVHQPWEIKPNYNPNPGPYYGIEGIDRVSNRKVALFLMALGILGAIFGFSSVKRSFELNRCVQDEISAEANLHHASVVADAQKYGNEEQMRRMIDRLARDPLAKAAAK